MFQTGIYNKGTLKESVSNKIRKRKSIEYKGVYMKGHTQTDQIIQKLLDGQYDFNSHAYGIAVNEITITESADPVGMLSAMSESNNFAVIAALALILQTSPLDFLKENEREIRKIIRKAVRKKYFRANSDFSESILFLDYQQEDYECFLEMMSSEHFIEQDAAISKLLYLTDKHYDCFVKITDYYDFSVFRNLPKEVSATWFSQQTMGKNITFKKIILAAVYKNTKDKNFIFSITDKISPELFDFIYFLPDLNQPIR